MTHPLKIGKFRHGVTPVSLASEYAALAREDESAARLLHDHGRHRHAAYFAIQAIEKFVRAEVFALVSARHACHREWATTHNLDDLLAFLVEIVCHDDLKRRHVTSLLNDRVMGGVRFGRLHNDLRYPRHSERYGTHSVLEVEEVDARRTFEILGQLKHSLENLERLRS